ncbi:MAG TPA: TIR domain-containing protein [Thermoanaerobaculia bacterium]|nr:TIR domain-containing protein [Thermoanaerobaculia bacterium]
MPTIFISYAEEDRVRAKAIHDRLQDEGWDCWIAPDDIPSGEVWAKSIGKAIQQSETLLLIFSRSANVSTEVEREILLARNYKVPVLPFVVEEFDFAPEFAYHLVNIQKINAHRMSENEALKRLQEDLARYSPAPVRMPPSLPNVPPANTSRWREDDWERLLYAIEERQVIPIIGPELLEVTLGGKRTQLYSYTAQHVAEDFEIPIQDIASAGVLADLADRWLAHGYDPVELHRALKRALPPCDQLEPPEPLQQLARIRPLTLFITTTFDPLMELALNQERFGGEPGTRVVCQAPDHAADPPEQPTSSQEPVVFHLDGLAAMGSHPRAADDMREVIRSIASTKSPVKLLDELENRDILLLGTNLSDSIAPAFLRLVSDLKRSTDRRLITIADSYLQASEYFLQYLMNPDVRVRTHPEGAVAFVRELFHRWSERQSTTQAVPERNPQGSIFISFASEDRASAERLAGTLQAAHLDVCLGGTGDEDRMLRQNIRSCSVFIPILSRSVDTYTPRSFRREWSHALEIAREMRPSARFIIPVVLDDLSFDSDSVPHEFRELHWMRMDIDASLATIVDAARAEYRHYRRSLVV